MCANIYSIRRKVICFRESEIGILDYWSEQMCIKTQRFSLLSPAAARISCYDVHRCSKINAVTMYFGNSRDTVQGSFLSRPGNVLFAEHMSKLFQDV